MKVSFKLHRAVKTVGVDRHHYCRSVGHLLMKGCTDGKRDFIGRLQNNNCNRKRAVLLHFIRIRNNNFIISRVQQNRTHGHYTIIILFY
jgi:hypothetical protein